MPKTDQLEQAIRVLSAIPYLGRLPPQTLAAAASSAARRAYDPGEVVFLEGEMLYNTKGEVPEGDYTIPIGKAELKREEDNLAALQKDYNNGEPERLGDERNYQKYLDRVADMKAAIARKESDIAAIKREISKLPQ